MLRKVKPRDREQKEIKMKVNGYNFYNQVPNIIT